MSGVKKGVCLEREGEEEGFGRDGGREGREGEGENVSGEMDGGEITSQITSFCVHHSLFWLTLELHSHCITHLLHHVPHNKVLSLLTDCQLARLPISQISGFHH